MPYGEEESIPLDLGCGYGRLAYALNTEVPNFRGRYIGLDILVRHIEWCQQEIERRLPNFTF